MHPAPDPTWSRPPVDGATGPWAELLDRAGLSVGLSEPNPRVACRLQVTPEVGFLGHTQAAGHDHAEIQALRAARDAGTEVRGATAYVTLEPCSHQGRTPPCCDALVAAGVARVVVATLDPNPQVAGRGVARLRASGIEVEVLPADDPAARAARELNIGFFSRMIRGIPWVRMKLAASLDGVTALPHGESQWITGEAARADGHAWRARACAVLTGIGTVLEDDPMLDVRLQPATRQPHLVIVDSQLQSPPTARLFGPAAHGLPRKVWIYCAQDRPAERAALEALGARVRCLPGPGGKVDLAALLQDLARHEVNELHLEAGHKLNGSFLREGLVDECLLYLAPTLLGQGAGLSSFGPLATLADGLALRYVSVDRVGDDLRILARGRDRDAFLQGQDWAPAAP
ncbi:MAG TPA: bifunctional diaminohydroxyphosphoribosylaminopyrimidine deaminase/5-amino-6-(5-phosphoribosylamino)uracil reductase RibD [Hydrogenophaga sp.]|uniref:bifunctional diaminohydroxyphosphoribosylaminopyrimidine deaminase/5-amino-6-(5-phosphoribosylamino)uracil reductase RibD n=1 Tax=Hydrogenophaga sp. TaxID=1904254 RepID=UPI002B9D3CA7|nr:bifunctional diaminohydroxyphosphoribosylaminopyrimidine deaminase/5-amino-6-(5-phosphoribosylamino)uracil reductase RibD [Hydrogenophaga sp.]HMN93011.1 bifunctional diaminohydroxyphosphoribosylaminopyrimidine deaminase/5-amino-6-(5-phosphoribosylamino)uracil reductase RibD [Hydrogenophaga sp.]HMP10769.1 bifunctional diaminohydroxyphosphoribosylaminopyrimidine deaminase/5-amino-6-(5-phosphoribosylamino)uracil reductase RibD [Hydrogenophaga sp.]